MQEKLSPCRPCDVMKQIWRHEKIYVMAALAVIAYVVLCYLGLFHFTVCPSKLIYHIPCPSCGSTRALVKMLHGDVAGGILFNPNVLLIIGMAVWLPAAFYLRYSSRPDIFVRTEKFLRRPWVLIPFALAEAAIWIHNIVAGI